MTEEPELPSSRTNRTPGDEARAEAWLPSEAAELPTPDAQVDVAPVAPVAPETRHTRIARVTAVGGLHQLPQGFDEKDGDWETVRSDNPFEVLYLDHELWERVTGETVERHYRLLHDLWSGKKLRMHSGAAGRQIALRYGGEDRVDGYPKLVENAYRRLSTPEGREKEFRRIDDARREAGERAIAKTVTAYLADGLLDPSETDAILVDGTEAGLRLDETAAYLEGRLASGGFHSDSTPVDGTPAARVASVTWRTSRRRADDEARRAGAAVAPLKFEQGAAGSLAELAVLCDRFPEEAEGYLYKGYFEAWLSGRLGDAPMAAQVREARRGNPDDQSKGLELAVRAFLKGSGSVPAIAVRATPGSVRFGELPMGATAMQRLELAGEGRPRVWGSARLDPPVPGLEATGSFDIPGGSVELALDTTTVAPGDYVTVVMIEPEGGSAPTRVPVGFRVVALALQPEPAVLELGTLPFGTSKTSKLTVATAPHGGRLTGNAALTKPHPGVRLDGAIAGSVSQFSVVVDSRQFRAGDHYQSMVRLQTNAGTLDVPVSFRVGLRTNMVVAWTVGVAVLGGAAMWFTRELLANSGDFQGWYTSLSSLRGLSQTQAVASLVLFAVPLTVAWLVRRLVRRNAATHRPPDGPRGPRAGLSAGSDTPTTGAPATGAATIEAPEASRSIAAADAKTDVGPVAPKRGNPWPLVAFSLLGLTAWFGLRYPDGGSPVFWTLAAATVAGMLGWRRGRQVRKGRKRSATAVLIGASAALMSYSPSVWSVAPMGQWQPLAEAAWSIGVSPTVARGLGPSAGVRRSIERESDGDRQGAIREAAEAVEVREADSDGWLLLAAYHMEAGDLSRAYAAALKAQAARPASGTVLAAVGAVLLERGNADLALRALRTAVTRDPGSEAANLVYGCQLAGDDATVESASLFLRRAATAAGASPLRVSSCLARGRPYASARWWISALQHEYTPDLREASARVAVLPLPPMPAAESMSPAPESLAGGGESRP